jgi:uncharacterized protein YodC (DUF2158 family)
MNEFKFKVGDVVRLKSGGPPMTIHRRSVDLGGPEDTPRVYDLRWFSEHVMHSARLAEQVLVPDPDPSA